MAAKQEPPRDPRDWGVTRAVEGVIAAVRVLEGELRGMHDGYGQRETASVLGVAHTTYLRWMDGGLRHRLEDVLTNLHVAEEQALAEWRDMVNRAALADSLPATGEGEPF